MAPKLSENMSKLIHRIGREREDRIIGGEMKLTVTAIFLIDDNWKVFKEHREIIGKPLRQEEIEEVEKMLRCKDPRYGFATYVCLGCGTQKIMGFSCNGRLCTYCGYRHAREYAKRLANRLLDLPYRFFTFTIPAGLRSLVNQNAELLKIVQDSMFIALQETLELFQNLLESKKKADEERSRNRLQILCPRCFSEMELLFIAYLKDNELWIIGGWHWLEQRLIHREMMRREKQQREDECAQLDFLSVLGIAA